MNQNDLPSLANAPEPALLPVSFQSNAGVGISPATWAAASGVTKWVGEKIAGAIVGNVAGKLFEEVLDAIGLGGPDMVGKLDHISDQLVEVQRSLDRLTELTTEILKQLTELKAFMEKTVKLETLIAALDRIDVTYGKPADLAASSKANANGPGRAISLRLLTEKMPHFKDVTKVELLLAANEFAAYVSDIPTCIETIHTALAKAAFEQQSLLTHWAVELSAQVRAGKIDRQKACLVLECYFLQIISTQLKGVCVHCVALGTNQKLGPQFIHEFLADDFAKTMASETAAYLAATELLLCTTVPPIMLTGLRDDLGEAEFPAEIDELLLRAEVICAALNLVGHKPGSGGQLAPSIRAAMQGIYARALLRPSDLKDNVPPTLAVKGYAAIAGTGLHTLAFPCLDLVEKNGKATLQDATTTWVNVARYFWPLSSPVPAEGTVLDPSRRGGVKMVKHHVFGEKEEPVFAAGLFDVGHLYRGLPAGAKRSHTYAKFPGGYNDIGYYHESCESTHHPLTNEAGVALETFFNVVNIWRASIQQFSRVVHPLFTYAGGKARVRLVGHIGGRLGREPRKDGQGGTAFAQNYEIVNHLKLRFPNGSEKEFYNSVTSFGPDRPLGVNVDGGASHYWHEFYDQRRDSYFAIEFDLEPGNYDLVLDSEVAFAEGPKRYEGWQSSSLRFYLHGLALQRW
jgi:hypothetical protein